LGLLMLLVTPCTDWYLVFTGIAKGDVALASALLPLNAILQLVLLPIYLWGLGGSLVNLAPTPLLMSIIFVFLLPLGLAMVTRYILGEKWDEESWQILLKRVETGQLFALNGAIAAIFAAEGGVILQQPAILLQLLPTLALFYSLNFVLIQGLGRFFQFSYPQLACLSCTTLARNSPVALAIATSAFSHRPLISLALVVGPLIELPILALVSQILLQQQKRG
ncbi:MAG: arsenic resistance protein, partial [Halothece sp.]